MNAAKRAHAAADHRPRLDRIQPQSKCPERAPWADIFPNGARVRIPADYPVFKGRLGTVTRKPRDALCPTDLDPPDQRQAVRPQ